jgi:hypothetical protein
MKWEAYEDLIIYFFMEQLETYLVNDNSDKKFVIFDILQYGESIVTQ